MKRTWELIYQRRLLGNNHDKKPELSFLSTLRCPHLLGGDLSSTFSYSSGREGLKIESFTSENTVLICSAVNHINIQSDQIDSFGAQFNISSLLHNNRITLQVI